MMARPSNPEEQAEMVLIGIPIALFLLLMILALVWLAS